MKQLTIFLYTMLFSLLIASGVAAHSFDLNKQDVTTLDRIIADLLQVQTVFIGETHDQQAHHDAQLQVVRELHQAGAEISIGLEMFRQDGQAQLDRWVQGEIAEHDFVKIYNQHWSMWPLYRDIFIYARDEQIPLIGLNITREIVSQVGRTGFKSLSSEQRKKLPLATCDVSPQYRKFIRQALGNHGDYGAAFENFCEAQMLWDAYMARTLLTQLEENPTTTVVVLAGKGHSWKHGIPEQLQRRGAYSYRVLLPEIPGYVDLQTIDSADADYLLQGVELAPLH